MLVGLHSRQKAKERAGGRGFLLGGRERREEREREILSSLCYWKEAPCHTSARPVIPLPPFRRAGVKAACLWSWRKERNEKGSAPFCKLHPFPPASTHSSLLPFREPPPGCCHIPSNTAPAPPGPSSAPGWEPQRFKLFLDKLPPPGDSSQGEAAPAPPEAACGKRPIKTSAARAGCQAGSRR